MDNSEKSRKGWKTRKDRQALEAYAEQLRQKRKVYSSQASAVSEGGRMNRALSLGECCLQAIEKLQSVNGLHKLIQGTLFWTINEERALLKDGKKGYAHSATFFVTADEPAYTEEEIAKEIEETRRKMEQETEEMYGDGQFADDEE